MLPHYSPLKVAETFSALSGLFPGRIDLGLGRASGTDPMTTLALQRDRRHAPADDFPDQLTELLGLLDGTLPASHPFARLSASLPGRPERPIPWLLGSSDQSAIWAGQLGLPYAFADFINPRGAGAAAVYREHFNPSPLLPEPVVAVAAWAICADSAERGRPAGGEQPDGDADAPSGPSDRRAAGRAGAALPQVRGRRRRRAAADPRVAGRRPRPARAGRGRVRRGAR